MSADIVKHGLTWGLGHTLTLFAFAGAAILLGHAIPESFARPIETAVGVMLIGLGAHVLWRLWRDRVHFHKHGHGDGTVHFHAHSHAGETAPHVRTAHAHEHGFRWRTLLVGLMHGMAGSAALLVLTVSQASSPVVGLGYVALFGIGSMIGMGALSMVIAVPLAVSARWLTWANRGLQGAVGLATVAIGIMTVYETAFALRGGRTSMDRRDFLAGSAACALAAITGKAFAQSGPLTKIVFPFAAGGGGDTLCRVLAQHIGPLVDRNIIVENRTGGDGLIGIKAVKGANPDGTTILVTTGPDDVSAADGRDDAEF